MNDFLLQIYLAVLPVLLAVVAELIRRAISRAAAVAEQRLGVEVSAAARATLHSALMTGIQSAITRGLSGNQAVTAAISHVQKRGAPDAVRYFRLDHGDLQTMAQSKLQEIMAVSNPVPTPEAGAK